MTLHSYLSALQSVSPLADIITPLTASTHQETSPHSRGVLEAADLLKNFRQKYGFKSSLAYIFQSAALVSSILLNNPELPPKRFLHVANGVSNLHDDIVLAFNESYRCLLAMGTRLMVGCRLAHMVYQTSCTGNEAPLPEDTRRLLVVVNDIVWTTTDV
jgi:hypothetical protein